MHSFSRLRSTSYNLLVSVGRKAVFPIVILVCSGEALGEAFVVASPAPIPPSLGFLFAFESFFLATSTLFGQLQYFLYGLLVLSLFISLYRLKADKVSQAAQKIGEDVQGGPSQSRYSYAMLVLALAISIFLIAFPRLSQTLPIGGDTLYSMSVIQTMAKEGPIWALRFSDRPIFYLATYALGDLLGLSAFQLFLVLPVVLGALLVTSTWILVNSFYKEAAGYAALATAVSIFLMRTSIDLYASFFALSLFFITLAAYFSKTKLKQYHRPVLALLLVFLLLSYWFLWVFLMTILVVSILASVERRPQLRNLIVSNTPALAVLALFVLIAALMPPPAYWGFGSSFANYLGRAVSPAGALSYNETVFSLASVQLAVGADNFLMPLLATVALFMIRPKSFELRTLHLWAGSALGLSVLSIVQTHAALLFPMSILAGMGLKVLVDKI